MSLELPEWVKELPEEEQAQAKTRFFLKVAALYFSREGKLNTLSVAIGMHPNSLTTYDAIPATLAVKLEEVLGRDHFPRELFRPDLFVIQE